MDVGVAVGAVRVVGAATSAGHTSTAARESDRMSALASRLVAGDVEAADTGAYCRRHCGVVCHCYAVAEPTSHCGGTAWRVAAGVFASVLRGVCASHVLYAADILFLGFSAMVLR